MVIETRVLVIEMFYCLIGGVLTKVYTFVQTQ